MSISVGRNSEKKKKLKMPILAIERLKTKKKYTSIAVARLSVPKNVFQILEDLGYLRL